MASIRPDLPDECDDLPEILQPDGGRDGVVGGEDVAAALLEDWRVASQGVSRIGTRSASRCSYMRANRSRLVSVALTASRLPRGRRGRPAAGR
jgi:hypothetical protein